MKKEAADSFTLKSLQRHSQKKLMELDMSIESNLGLSKDLKKWQPPYNSVLDTHL